MDGTPTGGVGMYLGKCTIQNIFIHERCASLDRGRDAIGERVTHALEGRVTLCYISLADSLVDWCKRSANRFYTLVSHPI
jgi:hypothetical protein